MPSQINNPGNVHNVTANYLKTKPSTRFATRQLAFFLVHKTNVGLNPYEPASDYSSAVRAIQVNAEIYAVGEPTTDDFIVVVAQDTANDGDNTDAGLNEMAKTLSQVTGATVTAKHLHGSGFAGGLMAYSDESQAAVFGGDLDATP
jgi:hypothetical protein